MGGEVSSSYKLVKGMSGCSFRKLFSYLDVPFVTVRPTYSKAVAGMAKLPTPLSELTLFDSLTSIESSREIRCSGQ